MKKRKFIALLSISMLILCAFVIKFISDFNSIFVLKENKKIYMNDSLAMMFETGEGTGEYKMVTQSNWPTEKYTFNANLSRCENGSKLSWDNTKKAVVFSGNVTDKCYVYFDMEIMEKPLVDYVKSQYTGVQGENNIYYHDSSLTNGAGDNSYRYAGPSDDVNNFVCFGTTESPCQTDNLYRIIGVFGENYHGVSGEQLVKLIKYDYANNNLLGTNGDFYGSETPSTTHYKGSLSSIDTYYWNYKAINSATNTWSTSLLNKTNLNTNYLNNIGIEWSNKIATTTWKVGGNTHENTVEVISAVTYQNEIKNPVTTNTTDSKIEYKAKIGLMYASDYGFAASPSAWTTNIIDYNGNDSNGTSIKTINWMHMGFNEWTVSRRADRSDFAFFMYQNSMSGGGGIGGTYVSNHFAIRPSFNLVSSVNYKSGNGTMNEPIILS